LFVCKHRYSTLFIDTFTSLNAVIHPTRGDSMSTSQSFPSMDFS
jgi:hypothetical protein